MRSLAVVKVGGSLYDLPDLGSRLQSWLTQMPESDVLLVPGGGPTANVVRDFDRVHHLGEERAHVLALESLRLNAHFLAMLLHDLKVVALWRMLKSERFRHKGPARLVLNALTLDAHDHHVNPEAALPCCWGVTSDAIAARAAVVARADHLILLKSVTIPEGMNWEEAGRQGFVDEWFAHTVRPALPRLQVRAVNFREWCA